MYTFARIDAWIGRFHSGIGSAFGILIGLFAVAISLDLFMRLFGLGYLPGMQEVIEYLLFTGVFISAPWVLRLGSHVRVDLILSGLPSTVARKLDRFLDLFGLSICLALIWFGTINLRDAYNFGSMQMKYFQVPEWWFLTVFVVSFTMLAIEFLSRFLRGGDAQEVNRPEAGGI